MIPKIDLWISNIKSRIEEIKVEYPISESLNYAKKVSEDYIHNAIEEIKNFDLSLVDIKKCENKEISKMIFSIWSIYATKMNMENKGFDKEKVKRSADSLIINATFLSYFLNAITEIFKDCGGQIDEETNEAFCNEYKSLILLTTKNGNIFKNLI